MTEKRFKLWYKFQKWLYLKINGGYRPSDVSRWCRTDYEATRRMIEDD